jgi:endonuclease-3
MNPQKRHEIFARLRAQNPNPTTELHYNSTFELLIAVILSAQATDVGVNKATAKLFPIANTPEKIIALGLDALKDYLKTLNFFNNKAENVFKTCHLLVQKYNSEVPEALDDLVSLPGVGTKTAHVVLNTAFGHPVIAVDTHIFRVANRTKLATGDDVDAVAKRLEKFTPSEFKKDAHHWLILQGRYTCIARKPRCGSCIIEDLCEYKQKFLE